MLRRSPTIFSFACALSTIKKCTSIFDIHLLSFSGFWLSMTTSMESPISEKDYKTTCDLPFLDWHLKRSTSFTWVIQSTTSSWSFFRILLAAFTSVDVKQDVWSCLRDNPIHLTSNAVKFFIFSLPKGRFFWDFLSLLIFNGSKNW